MNWKPGQFIPVRGTLLCKLTAQYEKNVEESLIYVFSHPAKMSTGIISAFDELVNKCDFAGARSAPAVSRRSVLH
jgi:hypothetical protein